MKKKTREAADFYKELGPLSLVMCICDTEKDRLLKIRSNMVTFGININEVEKINRCILALDKKKSEVLKWMEKAIMQVPWN